MARVDDFQQARDLAARELSEQTPENISRRSGFQLIEGNLLRIPYLDRVYLVRTQGFTFSDEADADAQIPLQEQVLILHYLQGCRPVLANNWIAYREIPGASLYFGPFMKRAIEPLKKVFGQNTAAFRKAAERLQATPLDTGSCAYRLDVLPYAPIQIVIWEGDEEFPSEANILFDATVGEYLSPEDAAWLASLPVYRLMALSR